MTAEALIVSRSPYLMDAPPESPGRILLATGFTYYCALQFGFSSVEIANALGGRGEEDVIEQVAFSTRLLGRVLSRGSVRAWARPFGGGEPVALKQTVWELDDFSVRFATSAIDPKRPFDQCEPTHWLFVDLDDWNAILVASVDGLAEAQSKGAKVDSPAQVVSSGDRAGATLVEADRFIRMPELKHRTGLSKSTIYRLIEQGRFPDQVPMSGNIAAWREADVAAWIADPT